ncbi:hypothetical protein DTW90_32290 [Neorhizobium sp. P12A]|nr:hypothetical protein DTW90_32290 [Neorhizobium sp. P12A]
MQDEQKKTFCRRYENIWASGTAEWIQQGYLGIDQRAAYFQVAYASAAAMVMRTLDVLTQSNPNYSKGYPHILTFSVLGRSSSCPWIMNFLCLRNTFANMVDSSVLKTDV